MDPIALSMEPEDALPVKPTKKMSVDSGVGPGVIDTALEAGEDGVDGFTTREAKLLQMYYSKLLIAMEPEILDLSAELFSNQKITRETKYKVIDCPYTPSRDKCAIVLKDIESSVLLEPQFMSDLLSFFDLEGPDILKQLSKEMRSKLESMPPTPLHLMSEPLLRPRGKICFKPSASTPVGFSPGLSSMCEHCEFQNKAFLTMFEKFCQDSLKASLNLTETEEPNDNNHSLGDELLTETDTPPTSHGTLQASLDSELMKASTTPSDSSGPRSLESTLFKPAPPSIERQCSYDSVGGSDEYFAKLTNDFIEKIKLFHHKQKQSKKRALSEKKVISETLERTEEEFKKMSMERSVTEQELFDAQEEISVLKKSLEDAQARQTELVKEVLQCKQQLRNEKCVNGSSMDCKHFARCSSLERDNVSLKRQVKNLEDYSAEYKAKIEGLDIQIAVLLGK